MNKWFESSNFTSYAKTALAQAQKKIDQVLDIKEDEIISQSSLVTTTTSSSLKQNDNLNELSTSLRTKNVSSSSSSSIKIKDLDDDTDSFFLTFYQSRKKDKESNNIEASILTENSSSQSFQKQSVTNEDVDNSVSESLGSSVGTLNNEDEHSTINPKPSTNRPSNKQTKSQKQNLNLEKQNWIQSFVDSSSETPSVSKPNQDPKVETLENKTEINNEEYINNKTLMNEYEPKEHELTVQFKQEIPTSLMTESDFVKIDNNGSSLSGNASSTEEGLETCASSDIEVLSLPSNSGDQLLAFTQAHLSKSGAMHRIASLASMAKHISNDSNKSEQLKMSSMNTNQNVKQIFVKSPPPPLQPSIQPLNKTESSSQLKSNETLSNASDQDKAILEARETHILKLNKQNVKLQEENDNLMSEIEKLKYESNEKLQMMQRSLNDLNSKYIEANNDREQYKKVSTDLQKELVDVKNSFKEKEDQIEQLVQEGVKLSKQELNHSNIIKKLRSKEKETEEILTILKNDYQKSQRELEELKKVLDAKEDVESRNMETLKKLEKAAFSLEKELSQTKGALEDSDEKVKSLENTLQNSFKELSELHKANAAKENRINEATSSIETQLKEEIQLAVEKERLMSNKKQESLKWELESVRQDLARIEQQHSLREDMLRKEIADLQQQLRDSEMRNNELSQNISSATRPLLRQIENLQASNSSQIELLENAERNLIERLKESQANLCDITERNRQNQDSVIDLTHKCKTYEAQLQTLKQDKSKLNAEYQLCKAYVETYENEKLEKDSQNKALVSSLNQQLETLNREKKYLERQLEIEKTKVENDSKKFQALLNEYTKEKELLQQQQQLKLQVQPNNQNDSSQKSPSLSISSQSTSRFTALTETKSNNFFDMSMQNNPGGAINVLEMLQSRLQQKEGEIAQLQKEIHNLERVRESMAKEMVNLSNKLDVLQDQIKEYPLLQDNYNKLTIEYNALLTMYGEKTEETEELRMDLQDVKEMYKLQIEDLIKRSNI